MGKGYYEFYSEPELSRCLKYWSNACGELHFHGKYDLHDVSELPEELQRTYKELWKVGSNCYEYLAESEGKYYLALVSEFDDTFADDNHVSMGELYESVKQSALVLYDQDVFKDTVLILGKGTGCEECHEVIFLVPAMTPKCVCNEIEKAVARLSYR